MSFWIDSISVVFIIYLLKASFASYCSARCFSLFLAAFLAANYLITAACRFSSLESFIITLVVRNCQTLYDSLTNSSCISISVSYLVYLSWRSISLSKSIKSQSLKLFYMKCFIDSQFGLNCLCTSFNMLIGSLDSLFLSSSSYILRW